MYLIAHKVRGERAFDIAEQMHLPNGEVWWIISTSGHRAYPYWTLNMEEDCWDAHAYRSIPPMPADLRDHYTVLNPPAVKRQRVDDEPRAEDL